MFNKKRLAINMIAQIIAFTVNLGISFFLVPFIVKYIGSEAYGFVNLSNDFVTYAQVITVALNSMAGRFITVSLHQGKYNDVNKYFTSTIIANIILASFLIIPAILLLINLKNVVNIPTAIISDVTILMAFIFLNLLISIIGSVFGATTFACNRLDLDSLRKIESYIIKVVILVIAFSFFKPSVWYIGLATLICTIYMTGINIHYTKKLLPNVVINKRYFDASYIKTLLLSGIWNSFNSMSSIMSTGLNLLIANLFIGATAMGRLSIAKIIPNLVLGVFAMIASVFAPQLTISYAKGKYQDLKEQVFFTMKMLGMFSCIPLAILYAYGGEFYSLWMPTENARLLQALSIIICIDQVFVLPLEGLWNVFTATNKVKIPSLYLFFNSILTIGIVLISLQYTLDTNAQLFIIAGTSTLFSIIRGLTFLPMYGAYCLKLRVNAFYPLIGKNILSLAIATLISLVIKHYMPINSWFMLFVDASFTAIVSLLINTLLILGRKEREKLFVKITNKMVIKK
ncbi:MAG TPA: hypothetical protein DHW61_12775 [Lachnoclostridium phytofermentans]|uniref:Polysaccharide biosynthesis protein n=1 Tax=Lachnoclostridium phytofermentans TaxID=66219 RepID=A0A3D2X7Y5_9FIRM|nr:oligosaccharide flippase family protein [Lachnoclostridium sp.]HCL03260.1 hypothetical protein [Lachnoclostridium phytofermentans]